MNNYNEIIDSIKTKIELQDQILEIIKKENKKMNALEIMRKIKDEFTSDELRDVIEKLDYLCSEGLLKSASGNTYKLNDLLVGRVDLHEKGNAHVIIDGREDMFIPRDKIRGAKNKDLVSVEYTNESKNEGKIIKILKRNLGSNVAEVKNNNGEISLEVYGLDDEYIVEIEDTDINLVDGLLVHLEYVKDLSDNRVLARIDKVLGHKNALLNEGQMPTEVSGEIVKIACEYSLRLEFPEEVKEEAKKMPKALSQDMIDEGLKAGREDFRGDLIFTIDGKDTKDIDDAISVKILPNGNYQMGVHIADVSHYVKPGMALWKEAEIRSNSNYLGNKVIPMLPVELSNGICSLNPNEDRFTISCIMEIDHSGKVVESRVTKGIINSKKKMNYDAVEDILNDRETEDTKDYTTLEYTVKKGETLNDIAFANNLVVDDLLEVNKELVNENDIKEGMIINVPCKQILKNMHALSKRISAFKQRRGELVFVGDEVKVIQDENDEVIDIKARDQRPSERLIEDFMVVANEQVAAFLEEYNIATYRIHDKPLEMKINEFMKFLELLGIHYPGKIDKENISSKDCQKLLEYLKDEKMFKMLNRKLLRSMQKARYSTENIGHFGIASPKYTHFTSPIRRFDDLLNHTSISYILEDYTLQEDFMKSWKAYLTTICDHISDQERNSEKCEYAVDDMLKSYYMQKHIGEEFDATVDSLMPTAFFVQTDNYIEGRVDIVEKSENNYVGVVSNYDYNENLMAYTKNGKVDLRYGDRIRVRCVASDYKKRQVDFALIRKL